jgi:hypothetical protein
LQQQNPAMLIMRCHAINRHCERVAAQQHAVAGNADRLKDRGVCCKMSGCHWCLRFWFLVANYSQRTKRELSTGNVEDNDYSATASAAPAASLKLFDAAAISRLVVHRLEKERPCPRQVERGNVG